MYDIIVTYCRQTEYCILEAFKFPLQCYIYSYNICLAAAKLDKIQMHTEMYEFTIKHVLYKIISYGEHMT